MEVMIEKKIEIDEAKYADRVIDYLYNYLEFEKFDDEVKEKDWWGCLTEEQQIEFVISTFETAIKMMKGER